MKKALIYGLSAALLLASLTACSKSQTDQQNTEPEPPQIQATIPEAEPTPEVPKQTPVAPEPLSETVPVESDETEDSQTPEETAPPELFTEVNETVYAISEVNIREKWTSESNKVGSLSTGNSVTRTGVGKSEADGWSRVSLSDGSVAFINNSYLSTTKPVVQQQQASGGGSTTQISQGGKGTSGGGGGTTPAPSQQPSSMDDEAAAFLKSLQGSEQGKLNIDMSGADYSPESTSKAYTDGWTAKYD